MNKWLLNNLCDELKNRVTFFLTRYHKVHNSYGRAAISVDGEERVIFSWIEMCNQERDVNKLWEEDGKPEFDDDRYEDMMKAEWVKQFYILRLF